MLLELVLVLICMRMGCCIAANDESEVGLKGGDRDSCLRLLDVCADEATIDGGESSQVLAMLVLVVRDAWQDASRWLRGSGEEVPTS